MHVETEQIPALKLTVAPGGLKMREGILYEVRDTIRRRRARGSIGGGRAQESRRRAPRCAGDRPMRWGWRAQWSEPADGWGGVPY